MPSVTCFPTPKSTLYGVRTTTTREDETMTVTLTEVVPVPPSVSTRRRVTRVCGGREEGSGCYSVTSTVLVPVPGSSTTRTRVVPTTVRGTRVRTITEPTPTRTVFESTCVRVTATSTITQFGDPSFGHSPSTTTTSDESTSTRTLAVGDEPSPSDGGTKVNVGAIIGGLLGGFLAPFLLVLLVAWLRRKGLFRGLRSRAPQDEMRSVLPIGLHPPLNRSGSASDGGLSHAASTSTHRSKGKGPTAQSPSPKTPAQQPLDRRTSRSSRHSGPEYERRGAVSPVSSNYDFPRPPSPSPGGIAGVARRTSHPPHPPSSYRPASPSIPPNLPPSAVLHPEMHLPGPSPGMLLPQVPPQPVASTSTSSLAAASYGYYSSSLDRSRSTRRAVSPVSFSDHPYATAQPVPTGGPGGLAPGMMGRRTPSPELFRNGSGTVLLSSGPSSIGHGEVLPIVEEHSDGDSAEGSAGARSGITMNGLRAKSEEGSWRRTPP